MTGSNVAGTARNSDEVRVDALVVGAGFGGLYMIHRLREAGFSVQGIDRAGDVGGTWYWNRYPGARCDIPSLMYCYSWSEELQREWRWSEKYATQPEILAYAEFVADRFDLRRSYQFDTVVTAATFDEASGDWRVETDRGQIFRARWLVMATGCLSVPRGADLPGSDRFRGLSLVTGEWPHEPVDFKGKRVAVIGTGSSAIQSIPLIAKDAEKVLVFQRTPNFSLPALNCPLTDEEVQMFREAFPAYRQALLSGDPGIELPPADWEPTDDELQQLVQLLWNGGGLVSTVQIPNLTRSERINDAASDFVRGKIREIVKDPVLADKLTPRGFPIATKRACVDTDYYETYNRDNVDLIDLNETPIIEITETGVKTSAGVHEADIIVYALGFDAMTGALTRIDIRGRGGELLRDRWKAGPGTYLGMAINGFPNMFTVTGPGSPSVLMNVITAAEHHVDFIFDALSRARAEGVTLIEARPDAQDDWVAHCNAEAEKTLFPRAASWYMGANVPGKPRVFLPYVGEGYKKRIDREAAEGYPGFVRENAVTGEPAAWNRWPGLPKRELNLTLGRDE